VTVPDEKYPPGHPELAGICARLARIEVLASTIQDVNGKLREHEFRFQEERDRRYAEVALEREKALKIKETADLAALQLAREIQTYKDEKANELREQISSERGLYATKHDIDALSEKMEAIVKPMRDHIVASQSERNRDQKDRSDKMDARSLIFAVFGAIGVVATIVAVLIGIGP